MKILLIKRNALYRVMLCAIIGGILFFLINIFGSAIFAGAPAGEAKNYSILIQTDEHLLYLLLDGQPVKRYLIASGKPDWPSPIGNWQITSKKYWGEGFGGRWLGLNVPWGNYGIHGTKFEKSIGKPVSHGCIRMYNSDIRELYDKVSIGTQVVINGGIYGPFAGGFRELKPGCRGADVYAVQQRLKELGFFNAKVDGIFGEDTKKALHSFQAAKGLMVKNTVGREDYCAMGLIEFE